MVGYADAVGRGDCPPAATAVELHGLGLGGKRCQPGYVPAEFTEWRVIEPLGAQFIVGVVGSRIVRMLVFALNESSASTGW